MQTYSQFVKILIALFFLNIFDAIATLQWVSRGITEEANPLMAVWIELSPGGFILIKVVVVTLGLFLLYRFRMIKFARMVVWPVAAIYSFVFVTHCLIAFELLRFYLNSR
jgi:hypothetical protein